MSPGIEVVEGIPDSQLAGSGKAVEGAAGGDEPMPLGRNGTDSGGNLATESGEPPG